MKKTLLNFIISFLITFIPSILLVLLFTFLNYNNIINYRISRIIIYTLSSISFFIFSLIFSKKEKNHGLLRGLILSLLYTLVFLIVQTNKDLFEILFLILRNFSLIIGSILGVNFVQEN